MAVDPVQNPFSAPPLQYPVNCEQSPSDPKPDEKPPAETEGDSVKLSPPAMHLCGDYYPEEF